MPLLTQFPTRLRIYPGVPIRRDTTRLLLGFSKDYDRKALEAILESLNLVPEDSQKVDGGYRKRVNHSSRHFWVRSAIKESVEQAQLGDLVQRLKDLEWVGPVYQVMDGINRAIVGPLSLLPSVLVVQYQQGDEETVDGILSKIGLTPDKVLSPLLKRINFRYYLSKEPLKETVFAIKKALVATLDENSCIKALHFSTISLVSPNAGASPGDTHYSKQWNLRKVQANEGWDTVRPQPGVIKIAVIETDGFDLSHQDIRYDRLGEINLTAPNQPPSAVPSENHGTNCAGIMSAKWDNNSVGIAGFTQDLVRVLPIKCSGTPDSFGAGILHSASQNAQVINVSAQITTSAALDAAIRSAAGNAVICIASCNSYDERIWGIAAHGDLYKQMLVCGATKGDDTRCKKGDWPPPDHEVGSGCGLELSVVAPGIHIPTTSNGDTYAVPTGSGGGFYGTSAAAPHISALAGWLLYRYPNLTNAQVRAIIERTAEKVPDGMLYEENPTSHPNGTWNEIMGYGRINANRALNFADVMIKDWGNDPGTEPSSPVDDNYWDYSDLVVRPQDDDVFSPLNVLQSSALAQGQDNYLYVRVTNLGPAPAQHVTVTATIWPRATLTDVNAVGRKLPLVPLQGQANTQIVVTRYAAYEVSAIRLTVPLAAGSDRIFKFKISRQTAATAMYWAQGGGDAYYDAVMGPGGSPRPIIIVAEATADNDYAYETAIKTASDLVTRRNNLAQRQLYF